MFVFFSDEISGILVWFGVRDSSVSRAQNTWPWVCGFNSCSGLPTGWVGTSIIYPAKKKVLVIPPCLCVDTCKKSDVNHGNLRSIAYLLMRTLRKFVWFLNPKHFDITGHACNLFHPTCFHLFFKEVSLFIAFNCPSL